MLVQKKDNTFQEWSFLKVLNAVNKSAERAKVQLDSSDLAKLEKSLLQYLDEHTTISGSPIIKVHDLHDLVEKTLATINTDVYNSYREYRNYKKDFVRTWSDVYQQSKNVLYLGDKENANFDSTLNSTKGSLIRGYLTKELYKKFELSTIELQAINDGYIYIHDLRDLIFGGVNCCLFDIKTVLKDGFEMSNIKYREPKSVLSALQVIGDITLVATAQQFGGRQYCHPHE